MPLPSACEASASLSAWAQSSRQTSTVLPPIVTLIGYRFSFILSGTIVVETVFAWPGVGQLFFTSIDRLDYQVVQAIVLVLSILVVLGNLVTDLVYAYIDPRIRIR